MARFKNVQWNLPGNDTDKVVTNTVVEQALLMDIREELQSITSLLRRTFNCSNFLSIPRTLRSMDRQIKAQRRCPKHPRYTGAKAPTVDCLPCRRFYKAIWK